MLKLQLCDEQNRWIVSEMMEFAPTPLHNSLLTGFGRSQNVDCLFMQHICVSYLTKTNFLTITLNDCFFISCDNISVFYGRNCYFIST